MIQEGLFWEDDLVVPGPDMGQWDIWRANYSPMTEAFNFLEANGLGPDFAAGNGEGLTFFDEWENGLSEPGSAVIVDDLFAAALLQATLVERGIPVEILRQKREWARGPVPGWDYNPYAARALFGRGRSPR